MTWAGTTVEPHNRDGQTSAWSEIYCSSSGTAHISQIVSVTIVLQKPWKYTQAQISINLHRTYHSGCQLLGAGQQ